MARLESLKVLGECNPGFQAGRTTANAILPVRTAAEYCDATATKTEMAVLLGDLKWCFDTPANPIIELSLVRLGVPAFYATMLNDIDMHSAKPNSTSASTSPIAGVIMAVFAAIMIRDDRREALAPGPATRLNESWTATCSRE